jgi:very-short-patch-repair endonuclease
VHLTRLAAGTLQDCQQEAAMGYEGKSGKDFIDVDLVREHLDRATQFITERCGVIFRSDVEGSLRYLHRPYFDSPLEVSFYVWWEALLRTSNRLGDYLSLESQAEVTVNGQLFRVDFLVEPTEREILARPEWRPIAVELDGHAFHERTPEQVATRDRRDRALQSAGWHVFHYSFREFTTDPVKAISEVMVCARDQRDRVSRRVGSQLTPSCFDEPQK